MLYLNVAQIEMPKPFIHDITPLCYAMFFNFHRDESDELVCSNAAINSKKPFMGFWMLPSNDIKMKF